MKKLFTLLLCVALIFSFSVTAFADDSSFDQDDTSGGSTEVTYTLTNPNGGDGGEGGGGGGSGGSSDNSYIVTIPATVTVGLDDSPATLTVKATKVFVLSGKKLQVSLVNADGFNLTNGTSSIAYTVKKGDNAVSSGSVVLEVTGAGWLTDAAGTDGKTVDLKVGTTTAAVNAATASGDHTDTITFTCGVVAVS